MQESIDKVDATQEAHLLYDNLQKGLLNSYWGKKGNTSSAANAAYPVLKRNLKRPKRDSLVTYLIRDVISHHLSDSYTQRDVLRMVKHSRKQAAVIEANLANMENDSDKSKYLLQRFIVSSLRGDDSLSDTT
jgi:hypothetical protein